MLPGNSADQCNLLHLSLCPTGKLECKQSPVVCLKWLPFMVDVVAFVCRSDYPQHPVCLPHEDQEGVALLRSHSPPAGQILHRSSRHPVDCQHVLHGTDGSGNHRVPPLASLSAISSGEGCLFGALAHGGTLPWKDIFKKKSSLLERLGSFRFSSHALAVSVRSCRCLSCTGFLQLGSLCGTNLPSQCSSVSSGLFCSSCSCAQTPWMEMPH